MCSKACRTCYPKVGEPGSGTQRQISWHLRGEGGSLRKRRAGDAASGFASLAGYGPDVRATACARLHPRQAAGVGQRSRGQAPGLANVASTYRECGVCSELLHLVARVAPLLFL